MKRLYVPKRFPSAHLEIIEQANEILARRRSEGFASMTLREVYYQFIARDLFPDDRRWTWENNKWLRDKDGSNPVSTKNAQPNYKWLGTILVDARLAGLIDWDRMADNVRSASIRGGGWVDVPHYAESIGTDYVRRTHDSQDVWIEVWVEKDAQVGVVDSIVRQWRISSFACRGNVSSSAIYEAARRLAERIASGKRVVLFHLGDHDPNGIDMSRDNEDRLTRMILVNLTTDYSLPFTVDDLADPEFDLADAWADVYVTFLHDQDNDDDLYDEDAFVFRRIGLNMDQIEAFNPPPSPAKITDSRAKGYIERFGEDSWELDALSPAAMREIIETNVAEFFDQAAFDAVVEQERQEREILAEIPRRWDEIEAFLRDNPEST